MKTRLLFPLFLAGLLPFTREALAQSLDFGSGNLSVVRLGDGTETLTSSGNTVFIDQYTPAGMLVNSTNLPNSGANALILSGVASSEGGLTRSIDGTILALTGYHTGVGVISGSLSDTASSDVPRELATIDPFESYRLSQQSTSLFTAENPRYAAADGTNDFWVVGGANGVVYFNPQNDPVGINTSSANNRAIKIYNGNLYFTTQKGKAPGLYTFTTTPGSETQAGLITVPDVGTNLVFATGTASSPEGFAMDPSGTIVYMADSGGTGAKTEGGGIQKWIYNGSSWNWAYTFSLASAPQPPGAFAVTADFSGPNPVIYATTVETNATSGGSAAGNHLIRIVDTNAAAVVFDLAQAPTNEVLRGMDFAPTLLPLILSQPRGQNVTNGTPEVSLTVSAASPFALNYQWQRNAQNVSDDSNISGAATATINFATAQPANQGNYTVIVRNPFGAVTSSIAIFVVNQLAVPPAIILQPVNQTKVVGTTASLTVIASGTPSPSYQWSQITNGVTNALADGVGPSGETFSGSTNSTLFILNSQTNDTAKYFVAISDAAGSTNSQVVALTIIPPPPPSSTPYFIPGSLALLRLGDGTETLTHYGNTVFIDQYGIDGTLVSSTNLPDSGGDAFVLSGIAGSEGGLNRSADGTELALAGYNIDLSTVASSALSSTSASDVPRALATFDGFGNYNLVETTSSFFSGQNPRYVATDGANDFWAVGGANGVVYFNPPNDGVQLTGDIVNNRAIKIFNGNFYFSTQSGSPVGIYTFNTPGLDTIPNISSTLLFNTGDDSSPEGFAIDPTGTIAYVADSGGGTGDTEGGGIQKWVYNGSTWIWAYTFSLASAPQPPGAFAVTVDFSGPDPVIYATTVETNADSDGNVAGNHLVRIVDTNATATVTMLAQAPANEVFRGLDFAPNLLPQILVQPHSQSATNGTPQVSFTVQASSPYPLSFRWQNNDANVVNGPNISGAGTPTLTFQSAQPADQGDYTVIITNQYGAVTSSVAFFNVSALPTHPAIITQPASQTNFIGSTAHFGVVATGTPTPVYQWKEVLSDETNILADGPGLYGETISGSTNATLSILNIQANDVGTYFVEVSNSLGATNSQGAALKVVAVPLQIISQPTAQTILIGQTANFSAIASGTALNYQWIFKGTPLSDGTGSSGEMITGSATSSLEIDNAQVSDSGSYAVTVTNPTGSTNSLGVLLTVVQLSPPSFISYSTPGAVYTQNFDSLPSPGTNFTDTVKTDNPVTIGTNTYSFGDANPIDFAVPILSQTDLPGGLGLSNTMSGWYGWVQAVDFNRFGASAGDQGRGGVISFGSSNSYAASLDRALGLLTTGSKHDAGTMEAAFAARFINQTASTLKSINLKFTGELWRQSDLPKTLTVYYVIDPTGTADFDTNSADFVYLPDLDVSFPTADADSGGVAVDGTLPANQVASAISGQAITNWPPHAALWLVWEFTDNASQAQGIGIDNLSFSANAIPGVTTPVLGSAAFIGRGSNADLNFSFTNTPGDSTGFSVWSTTNLTLPFSQWRNLGHPVETPPGTYQFNDLNATNAQQFYRVTSP